MSLTLRKRAFTTSRLSTILSRATKQKIQYWISDSGSTENILLPLHRISHSTVTGRTRERSPVTTRTTTSDPVR